MNTILEKVQEEVIKWTGVTAESHRFGGIEFRLNKREMGQTQGDRLTDLHFPMKIRNELVISGRVSPHHILSKSGGVSYWMNRDEEDVYLS
jgi:hypothetical protein